ncbi:MAG TPA: lipoprotein [Rhizomicrobium sp.]|nr:lipoprotein [Rhizomicrobium sp.]
MTLRLFVAFAVLLALGGCGVKGDLEKPTQQTQKGEKNPSQPPSPIGR